MDIPVFKRSVFIFIQLTILTLSSVLYSKSPEEIAAAKDFTVEGIGFSMSKASLKSKFPTAQIVQEESDTSCNLLFFRIDSTNSTDGIDVSFFKGRVLKIQAWYFPARINSVFGSWDVIAEKLVKKIGRAEEINKGKGGNDIAEFIWGIPESFRFFKMEVTTKRVCLQIINTELLDQYQELKKSKADVGF